MIYVEQVMGDHDEVKDEDLHAMTFGHVCK